MEKRLPGWPGRLERGRKGTGDNLGLASEAGLSSCPEVAAHSWEESFSRLGSGMGLGVGAAGHSLSPAGSAGCLCFCPNGLFI